MSSKNFNQTQRMFGELSLKSKSASNTATFTDNLRSSAYKKSPEIHDLVRFQNAIMMKYYQTQDPHFKNIADALKPQIDEKIRAFNGDSSSSGKYAAN